MGYQWVLECTDSKNIVSYGTKSLEYRVWVLGAPRTG